MKYVMRVVALLGCGVVHGQESTINVLAVELHSYGYVSEITAQMMDLAEHWPNPNGVTVTLVNGGVPVALSAGLGNGTTQGQLAAAKEALVAQVGMRGVADIVIFFSPLIQNCGYGPITTVRLNDAWRA